MNRSQLCVANVQYKQASSKGAQQTSGLLGYLTYREGRDEAAVQRRGVDRWTDRGMGCSIKEIADRCASLRSDHVLMFSLVVNPNPDLVAMIPPERREAFVRELTENVVERFFEAREIDTGIEYSYCLHHRETTDPQSPGQHNPHTHVVLPGTVYDEDAGERVPLYFSQNRKVNHIDLLHRVTEQEIVPLLEREIRCDWEQRYDALEEQREQEQQVTRGAPDFTSPDEDGIVWSGWLGTRTTDESTSATGYYREINGEDGAPRVVFHPLVRALQHDEADLLARLLASDFGSELSGDLERLQAIARGFEALDEQQREGLFAELRALDFNRQPARWGEWEQTQREPEDREARSLTPPTRGFDIDFGF